MFLAVVGIAAAMLPGAAGGANVVPDGGFVVEGSAAQIDTAINVAHDAGARWVSISVSWESLEPLPDSYKIPGGAGAGSWNILGARIDYAKSKDMGVELRLSNAPAWASGRQGSDDPPTPANLGAYGDFLRDLAGRFGGQVDAYSPWNEPNRPAFWYQPNPDAFTALQKVAYTALKGADPSATVLYGPVVGRYASQNTGYTFLRRSYQLGLAGYADAIGWNGYPGGPPESPGPVEGGVPAGNTLPAQLYLRGIIDQYDPGRKVWLMELGWSTCGTSCDVSAANGVSEAQQADYLTRAFVYRRRYLSSYVERIFWYDLRDVGTSPSDWFGTHGVVRNDFSPKPALAAFAALGVETPGSAGSGGGTGTGSFGSATSPGLPASAARLALPAARATARGHVALGPVRVSARRGIVTLRFTVRIRGGASRIQIEGYRGRRWHPVTRFTMRRSGRVKVQFRDKAFVGYRLRATVPGATGYRVGRVVKVPAILLKIR